MARSKSPARSRRVAAKSPKQKLVAPTKAPAAAPSLPKMGVPQYVIVLGMALLIACALENPSPAESTFEGFRGLSGWKRPGPSTASRHRYRWAPSRPTVLAWHRWSTPG